MNNYPDDIRAFDWHQDSPEYKPRKKKCDPDDFSLVWCDQCDDVAFIEDGIDWECPECGGSVELPAFLKHQAS